jgi:hypothetical protein
LRAYIEQDDPAAAQRVSLHIIHNVETLLPNSPEMGRPGRVPGTRELVIPRTPFIVPCRTVWLATRSSSCASTIAHASGPRPFKTSLMSAVEIDGGRIAATNDDGDTFSARGLIGTA